MRRSRLVVPTAPLRLVLIVALVLGGVACDAGPSEPDTPAVTTIVVSGAPTGALHVAATAQLAATTLSSTGAVINGATVSWKSSNEAATTGAPATWTRRSTRSCSRDGGRSHSP